ncbi:hypothetical protein C0991_009185 [Blastosporella zonata]|nr:hypothetical protein C0991_009185 [Blastosporella zonata]
MSIQAGNRYHIVNVKSDTALDLSGTDNVSIIGWEKHNGDNQKASRVWELEHENNQWTFRNVGNGKYLGIAEGDLENGLALRAVDNPFAWDIFPDHNDNSVYRCVLPLMRFLSVAIYGAPFFESFFGS